MEKKIPLGSTWKKEKTTFNLFAPKAKEVFVRLYEDDFANLPQEERVMEGNDGYFYAEIEGDSHGKYYTYLVDGVETVDPYAKSCGANGRRGVVVDFSKTNPDGWEKDSFSPRPPIIWEAHIRDFSSDPDLPIEDRGKFTAFREGVTTLGGAPALIDHLKELGVTYVQLLPVCDFASVDELNGGYNWGYDPAHYFALEGSYSQNPRDGLLRIKEFKRLVQTLHRANIGVIMDVVYNHVYDAQKNPLAVCAPDCYFRKDEEGRLCDGAGCGNEMKSEHPAFRQLMIDSVCFFAKEYHIDGFRFDLMGLHDVDTMNALRETLDTLFENGRGRDILTYGEPWYVTPPYGVAGADKQHVTLLNERIGMFNDDFRDGVRGKHFHGVARGYVQGERHFIDQIMRAVLGGTGEEDAFPRSPLQQVLYCACHDDLTLFDQIVATTGEGENRENMQKMAAFLLFSGLGLVFMQAGEEFLRSKRGNANSYKAGDEVNQIRWSQIEEKRSVVDYYRGLIALRLQNPAFKDMKSAAKTARRLSSPEGTAAYIIGNTLYAVNATDTPILLYSGKKKLKQVCDIQRAGVTPFIEDDESFVVLARGVYAAIVEE